MQKRRHLIQLLGLAAAGVTVRAIGLEDGADQLLRELGPEASPGAPPAPLAAAQAAPGPASAVSQRGAVSGNAVAAEIAKVVPPPSDPALPPQAPPPHAVPPDASPDTAVEALLDPPWELFAPYAPGREVGLGWRVGELAASRGAAVLTLYGGFGARARVLACRLDDEPRGLAQTSHLDLLLVSKGAHGDQGTDESLGRVIRKLAKVVGDHEGRFPARGGLASYRERQAALGPDQEERKRPEGVLL